jgi:ABC-type lipoprotein export system ATPase subunit
MNTSIIDIPRGAREKDNFGIAPFENGLKRFIENSSTPITIALQGEWGSGKTSLMNLLQEHLCDNENNQKAFNSVWLNTWEFSLMKDAQSTLVSIIYQLINEVTTISQADSSKTEKLFKSFSNFSSKVALATSKVIADKAVSGSGEIIEAVFKPENTNSISEIRKQLEDIITVHRAKVNNKGFIFFIDDLDRIDPPVAVELLELLKNIFTLKNCIFVLAIDYDVVVKGLEPKFGRLSEINEREFRSFFDKIIQVPFSMPVSSYRVNGFLKESLKNIEYISPTQASNDILITKLSNIANLSVGSNPRSIKRLLNSLSLIKCINDAKEDKDLKLVTDTDILINFFLVSIQIAYPKIYNIIVENNDFTAWNESTALNYNLKPLDEYTSTKLNQMEEFDEEWEKVLFRICETDYYLKQKALSISSLLNMIKEIVENDISIDEDKQDLEQYINRIISLSAITNLKANDSNSIHFHKPTLLKNVRDKLIVKLKELLPNQAKTIKPTGKRVQVNAPIIIDDNTNINLTCGSIDGKIKLDIWSYFSYFPQNFPSIKEAFKENNLLAEFEAVENEYNLLVEKFMKGSSIFKFAKLLDREHLGKDGFIQAHLVLSVRLDNVNSFYEQNVINKIADSVIIMHEYRKKILALIAKT